MLAAAHSLSWLRPALFWWCSIGLPTTKFSLFVVVSAATQRGSSPHALCKHQAELDAQGHEITNFRIGVIPSDSVWQI